MNASAQPGPALTPGALDDTDALLAADSGGWLRGAAGAGAQVRAVAEALREGVFESLRATTVRSVVLVAPRGPARHAAVLLQSLVGTVATVPVVHAAQTPRWVGTLDVVMLATDDPGDGELAHSVRTAVDRGADVVLCAPAEGLLTPAAAGRAVLMPPRVWVPRGMDLLHFVAAGLAVLGATGACPAADLAAMADELDAEAERDQAAREVFANPAKALALRCSGRELVVAADKPGPLALAAYLTGALLRHAGVVASPAELHQVLAAELPQALAMGAVPMPSLFHDPDLDGPPPLVARRVLLLGTAGEQARLAARSAALPDVELVLGDIKAGSLHQDLTAELLQLAARCETAAVYLRLGTAPAGAA